MKTPGNMLHPPFVAPDGEGSGALPIAFIAPGSHVR